MLGIKRKERQKFPVTVESVSDITPHMRRFRVAGDALRTLELDEPAQWMKVFVPCAGDQSRVGRAYTVRNFDPSNGRMDLDFVLHGDTGPASRWAAHAWPGEQIIIAGPGRGYPVDPTMRNHLLIGDATSLPAIAAILEVLPETAEAVVFVEVATPEEEQPLMSPASVERTWLHSGKEWPGTTGRLELAVQNVALPLDDCSVWVAGESLMVRSLRSWFLADQRLSRSRLHAKGYWKLGVADHRDRD
ncbi:siderophore-interacting protein [Gluconobacter sp.]|uniref:siderophore-interacting protein n=1 Tax=Gluconobacter sp. TaxID=1876758 RepID=UPI0039ECF7AE